MTQRLSYDGLIPDGLRALGGVYAYVNRSGLEKSLVDLCYLRASQVNGCAYCIDMHTHDLLKQGAAPDKVTLLPVWRETGELFTPRERAALAWTESVTRIAETHVPDTEFDSVHATLSDKELADLTLAIGLINVYNRLAVSFRRTPRSLERPGG